MEYGEKKDLHFAGNSSNYHNSHFGQRYISIIELQDNYSKLTKFEKRAEYELYTLMQSKSISKQ